MVYRVVFSGILTRIDNKIDEGIARDLENTLNEIWTNV